MKTLKLMFKIAKTHDDITHPHSIGILNDFKGISKSSLKEMVENDWVKIKGNQWSLTPTGFDKAQEMFHEKDKRMINAQLEIQLIAIVVAMACAIPGVFLVLRKCL